MLHKLVAFQARMGRRLTLDERILIFKQRPDVVCFPEYWQIGDNTPDLARAALLRPEHLGYLSELSEELDTCVVGGTVVEAVEHRLHNACYVIDRGRLIGRYFKRYPVPNEQKGGIHPGEQTICVKVRELRIGLMICGDVFYPSLYDDLRRADADVIVIPTTSPYRHEETVIEKHERDNKYFLSGARQSGALVAKVCGVGSLFGKPLQGRSLIAMPWGIIKRVDPENESKVRMLTVTFDVDELREFRHRLALRDNTKSNDAGTRPSPQSIPE